MAVLDETARVDVWARLMRKYSTDGDSIGINKADLRAAINALDDFMDANAATINNALPEPAKSSLTQAQKALMLSFVVLKRYQVEV
jgi:hypothetical protein